MEPTILDKLLLIVDLFQRDMARAFKGTPLTQARVGVLWILQTRGPSTQQAVAKALGVSAHNISILVDALEAAGYARRTPHPSDRRAVMVELTRAGAELMQTMQREHAELRGALLDAVPAKDLASFERGIDAIVARLAELAAAAASNESENVEVKP